MQNEETYSKRLSEIATTKEALSFGEEIDVLINSMYKIDDKTGLSEEFLRNLKTKIAGLRPIKLTLAFEPDGEFIKRLFAWVRQNIGDSVVLDFSVNPEILGGALVEWQGKYFDLSLKNSLGEKYGI